MGIFRISSHTNKPRHPWILKHLLLGRWGLIKPKIRISWLGENQHEPGQGWIPMDPKYPLEHLGGSWIQREGAGWEFGDHRAASHMTLVSMTTPNIHKVFPAIQKLPKWVGRGEDFKIYYIREEFPLSRAVTQKKGGKEDRNLSSFTKFVGWFVLKFVVNKGISESTGNTLFF